MRGRLDRQPASVVDPECDRAVALAPLPYGVVVAVLGHAGLPPPRAQQRCSGRLGLLARVVLQGQLDVCDPAVFDLDPKPGFTWTARDRVDLVREFETPGRDR